MTKGFVTPTRFNRIVDVPFNLAQTEVRSGKAIQVAQIPVNLNQIMLIRSIVVHLPRILTPGEEALWHNEFLGFASVGVYFGKAISCPIAFAKISEVGSSTVNPFAKHIFNTPGVYTVRVSNNTRNLDLSVVVTGVAKLYL